MRLPRVDAPRELNVMIHRAIETTRVKGALLFRGERKGKGGMKVKKKVMEGENRSFRVEGEWRNGWRERRWRGNLNGVKVEGGMSG